MRRNLFLSERKRKSIVFPNQCSKEKKSESEKKVFVSENSDEIIRNDDIVGMKWKQQSGQFRWARANRLHLSSPKPIYLVPEAKQLLGQRIHCRHIQCHTVSHVAVLAESMKFIGRLSNFQPGTRIEISTRHFKRNKCEKLRESLWKFAKRSIK